MNAKLQNLLYDQRIVKLKRRARAWGGRLIEIKKGDGRPYGMQQAPFSGKRIGECYSEKIVYYSRECLIPEIIHEMGHVFACNHKPMNSDEWSFFGWEWTLAKTIGLTQSEFVDGNYDYAAYWPADSRQLQSVGDLKLSSLKEVLADAVASSKENGLIVRGRAIAIR